MNFPQQLPPRKTVAIMLKGKFTRRPLWRKQIRCTNSIQFRLICHFQMISFYRSFKLRYPQNQVKFRLTFPKYNLRTSFRIWLSSFKSSYLKNTRHLIKMLFRLCSKKGSKSPHRLTISNNSRCLRHPKFTTILASQSLSNKSRILNNLSKLLKRLASQQILALFLQKCTKIVFLVEKSSLDQ